MKRNLAFIVCASVTLAFVSSWLVRHVVDISRSQTNFAIAYAGMFGYLAFTVIASFAARPHTAVPGADLDALSVEVVVPIYNEDPALLAAGIDSMTGQTRRPQTLWLVDDGSAHPVHESVAVAAAVNRARGTGIDVLACRQPNQGKRHAQAFAFARSNADVFVTVDSDTILRADAIEKLLVPFSRESVMCVGGTALGQNFRHSLLTRVVELGFVMAFLSGRAAEGCFGAVRVNCGIIAAYRGDVVRENLHRYLNQTFLGQPVAIGDDRALTIYCKERGRAEYQPAAIAYSALPVTFSHLVRQRARWARSWYWGTMWLLRRRPTSVDFLLTFVQVLGMVMYLTSILFAVVGTAAGVIAPRLLGWTVVTSMTIGMVSTMRYVIAARPDDSWFSRFCTWLLSPLSSLLYMFVLVPLYWYAAFSLRPKGWGTRQSVEVGMHRPQQREPVAQEARAS